MRACVLCQIPYSHASRPITADDLALIRMNDNIVCGRPVVVAALNGAGFCFPDFDRPILGTRHHPLALAVKRYARDVARVSLECQQWIGICGLDIVELDRMMARRGHESLVGGNTESIDLRIGMLNRARANSRERFPKPDSMVITRCRWVPVSRRADIV